MEIIEAARKILTQYGVSGLTIKNLAREMGFSEGALYRHFDNKEEIIIALLEYLADTMNERFEQSIRSSDSPEEKFTQLFQSQISFFNEHPHFVVAVFSDGLLEENERINQIILRIMALIMTHLMPVIMEGQQKKVFTTSITTEELMHVVLGSFRLQMFKWRIARFEFDILRNGDNLIRSLLTLIKTK